MKKIKNFALFLFLLMGMFLVIPSTQVKAEELVIGDWEITTSDTGAVLSGYVGTDDTVTIPTRLGGYNIRTIASGAFEGNKTLIDVTIPKEITKIQDIAFKNCTNLQQITFEGNIEDCSGYSTWTGQYSNGRYPQDWNYAVFYNAGADAPSFTVTFANGVTKIPAYLFATGHGSDQNTNAHITKIEIANSVKEIGNCAFFRCYNVESISFGSGVSTIGESAFAYNTSLKNLTLGSAVYEIKKNAFEECTSLAKVNLNASLGIINSRAFINCTSLAALKCNNKLTTIDEYAFEGCSALKTVDISKSVTKLSNGAFKNTTALESVIIRGDVEDCSGYSTWTGQYSNGGYPQDWNYSVFYNAGANAPSFTVTFAAGVTKVPAYLFATGHALDQNTNAHVTSVTFADTVKEIGDCAFFRCYNMEKITFGKGVEIIGSNAFGYNFSLKTLTLGNNVTEIKKNAFEECTSLTKVNLNTKLGIIGTRAFINCTALETLKCNDKLTTIDEYAFEGCSALKSVDFSKSVTKLANGAFKNTTALESVVIRGDIEDCSGYSTWTGQYSNGGYPQSWNYSVFYNAGANAKALKVTFTEGVTKVPAYLFATGYGIEENVYARVSEVSVPSTLKTVGDCAFYKTYALKKYTDYSGNASYGKEVFVDTASNLQISGYYGSLIKAYATEAGIKFKYLPPAQPVLAGISNSADGVTVQWKKAPGANGYYVYRKAGNGAWAKIATINKASTVSYTDKKAQSGTLYSYTVAGFVGSSRSTYHKTGLSMIRLGAVKIASATNGAKGVTVKWDKVSGVNGYRIYRSTKATSGFAMVGSAGRTATSFVDTTADSGKTYYYAVRATKQSGKKTYIGAYKNTQKVICVDAPKNVRISSATENTLTLAWAKVSGASGYIVERKLGSLWLEVARQTKNSFKDTELDSTESYTYRVRAYKKSGGSEYKSTAVELIGTTSPAPVSSFKASEVTKKSVTLSWKKNANASGYQIQMYSGGTWATLATITKNSTTSYKIPSGLKSGTSYKFRICSFSGNGAKAAYSSYKTITVKTSK